MMTNQMGFNADVTKKVDILKSEPKKSERFKPLVGLAVVGTLLFGGYSFVSSAISEGNQRNAEAHEMYVQEKAEKDRQKAENKELAAKYYDNKELKQMSQEYVNKKAQSNPSDIIAKFNKELDFAPENKIFKSKFSVGSQGLIMEVDIDNAAKEFAQSDDVVRMGVSQGSDAYKSYLERYKNLTGNENSVLHISDKHGILIAEVK